MRHLPLDWILAAEKGRMIVVDAEGTFGMAYGPKTPLLGGIAARHVSATRFRASLGTRFSGDMDRP